MSEKSISIGDAIRFGWDVFKSNAGFLIAIVLIAGVISAITSSLQTSGTRGGAGASALLIGLLVFAINAFVAVALINVSLKFVDNRRADFADLTSVYPLFFPYAISSILYSLIVTLGLIFFIIPGIILAIRYQFFGYYIVDKKAGIIDSLKLSWNNTKGVTGSLFLLDLALIGIVILGAIALGVGLLVAIPVAGIAFAYAYRRLQTQTEPSTQARPAA